MQSVSCVIVAFSLSLSVTGVVLFTWPTFAPAPHFRRPGRQCSAGPRVCELSRASDTLSAAPFASGRTTCRALGFLCLRAADRDSVGVPPGTGKSQGTPEVQDQETAAASINAKLTGASIDYERDLEDRKAANSPGTSDLDRNQGRIGSHWVVRDAGDDNERGHRAQTGDKTANWVGHGNNVRPKNGKRSQRSAAWAEKRAAGNTGSEESLADVVRRKGTIGAGVRAVKRMVQQGRKVNGRTFSQLMTIAHEQMRRGRANLDDTADVVQLARDCGVPPDLILYNAWLSATATAAGQGKADLSDGSRVLQQMRAEGVRPDAVTFNSLLHVCAMSADTPGVVSRADTPGVERVPVTPMTGYSVLQLMVDEGLSPNEITFATLMNLCARSAAKGRAGVQDGRVVLERMQAAGVAPDVRLMNTFMLLVANAAQHGTASLKDGGRTLALMRKLRVAPNLVTFNSLLKVVASLAGRGDAGIAEARAVLAKIDEEGLAPDTITFNALLDICARTGDVSQLNPLLDEMDALGLRPDLPAYTSALRAVARAAEVGRAGIREADALLDRMRRQGLLELDAVLCNAFLSAAAADGSRAALRAARELLPAMRLTLRDTYTYAALLTLIGKVEGAAAAVEVLSEAREAGVRPNRYMYNAALRVCADAGEHSRLLSLASAMRREGVFWDDMTRSLVADAKEQERQEGR